MSQSLIKIIIFCAAFCSLPGSASMASTIGDNYDGQGGNFDNQVGDTDSQEVADAPLASDIQAAYDVLEESNALLESSAEGGSSVVPSPFHTNQKVLEADIVVGRF